MIIFPFVTVPEKINPECNESIWVKCGAEGCDFESVGHKGGVVLEWERWMCL